jgi:Trypsin-like peptidase domain
MLNLEAVKNSVCILYRITQEGVRRGIGTGFFFMDDNIVATSRHIMEDHANAQWPYGLLFRPSQSSEGSWAVECGYHIEQDLALVKLERRYPVIPFKPCHGTTSGFTYIGYDPSTESMVVERVPTFFPSLPREGKHSITHFFEWNGILRPGNSGGPLIGDDGGVAGILTGVANFVEQAGVSNQFERSSAATPHSGRCRAVFCGPLMDLYLRWMHAPGSIKRLDVPFT